MNTDRSSLRQMYLSAWQKHRASELLTPIDAQIIAVILEHPEYHIYLADDRYLHHDFKGSESQANPFFHMSLHLSLRDQIRLNQPQGIQQEYHRLTAVFHDEHHAEHAMMTCLEHALTLMQSGKAPGLEDYFSAVCAIAC